MPAPINIRNATLADLPQIVGIERACFEIDRFSRRQFIYLISRAKGAFFAAEADGQIVGYISLLRRDDSANLRIYAIAVHPDYRGRHIGQLLVDKAKEYAIESRLQGLTLEVRVDNTDAIKLYEKNGFTVVSKKQAYYSNATDALKMSVVL